MQMALRRQGSGSSKYLARYYYLNHHDSALPGTVMIPHHSPRMHGHVRR